MLYVFLAIRKYFQIAKYHCTAGNHYQNELPLRLADRNLCKKTQSCNLVVMRSLAFSFLRVSKTIKRSINTFPALGSSTIEQRYYPQHTIFQKVSCSWNFLKPNHCWLFFLQQHFFIIYVTENSLATNNSGRESMQKRCLIRRLWHESTLISTSLQFINLWKSYTIRYELITIGQSYPVSDCLPWKEPVSNNGYLKLSTTRPCFLSGVRVFPELLFCYCL